MERENSRMQIVPLTTLRKGETGTIVSIQAGYGRGKRGHRSFEKRLMDMGLTPGTSITVIRSAPFYGPIEVHVRDSKLALGRGMAKRIFVEMNAK